MSFGKRVCLLAALLVLLFLFILGFSSAADVTYCVNPGQCYSGNCDYLDRSYASICCPEGKECCLIDADCSSSEKCSAENVCVKKNMQNGEECTWDSECASGNCYVVCCAIGERCCRSNVQCESSGKTCDTSLHYCVTGSANPPSEPSQPTATKSYCEPCSDASECIPGYCSGFPDDIKKCTNGYNGKCCTDLHWIMSFIEGTDCCPETASSCGSGMTCENYKCVQSQPSQPSGAIKGYCQECSTNSDCGTGVCANFSGWPPKRCIPQQGLSGICCFDDAWISNFQKYTDCCVGSSDSEYGCNSGMACQNYKCGLATGQTAICGLCNSSTDCVAAGVCTVPPEGGEKICMTETISCCGPNEPIPNYKTGIDCCSNENCENGKECISRKCVQKQQAQQPAPTPTPTPAAKCSTGLDCGNGCCASGWINIPGAGFQVRIEGSDSKGCVQHNKGFTASAATNNEGFGAAVICCNNYLKAYRGESIPTCCSDSDCAGGYCINNYCAKSYTGFYSEIEGVPSNLLGFSIAGLSEKNLRKYNKEELKRTIFGVGLYASEAESWEAVARYELEQGKIHIANSQNLGFFKTVKKWVDRAYAAAQFKEATKQIKSQYNTLKNIRDLQGLKNNASTVVSFAGNLSDIYGGIYTADQIAGGNVGIPEYNPKIMRLIGVATSGGTSLIAELSDDIFSKELAQQSISYELDMGTLNMQEAMLASKIHDQFLKVENPKKEDIQEVFASAKGFVVLKKLENLLKYRDDIATWKEKKTTTTNIMEFIGFVDAEKVMEEKKASFESDNAIFDRMLAHLKELETKAGVANAK